MTHWILAFCSLLTGGFIRSRVEGIGVVLVEGEFRRKCDDSMFPWTRYSRGS